MRAHFIPITLAINLLLAVFVSYCIAVSLRHVPALLPYISDAGVLVPERSVFSQLISVAVIFHVLTVYVRYELVEAKVERLSHHPQRQRRLLGWNRIGLYLGLCVSFGLSLIGNFQLEGSQKVPSSVSASTDLHLTSIDEDTETENSTELQRLSIFHENRNNHAHAVKKVHWAGAFLTFVGGIIWMFLQSVISIIMCKGTQKGHWKRRTAVLRLIISLLSLICLLLGISSALGSAFQSDDSTGEILWNDVHHDNRDHWRGKLSLTAAFCEWILALLIVAFTFTLVPEFKSVHIHKPTVNIYSHRKTTATVQQEIEEDVGIDKSTNKSLFLPSTDESEQ